MIHDSSIVYWGHQGNFKLVYFFFFWQKDFARTKTRRKQKSAKSRWNSTYCKPVQGSASIKQIKKKITTDSNKNQVIFSFKPTTVENVKKLLNEIDTKKAVSIDAIPPELIKMASSFLAPILTTAINSSIENSVFPENAKVATVVPLDKGKPDKNDISNFRPVSLLNTFSKFYERVIKDQLVLSMENYFLPMVSAYRKNYSTQHVITHLVEE